MTLIEFCQSELGVEVKHGLIQNPEPITFNRALMVNHKYLLRWKLRVCKYCNATFNIGEQGFAYNCGCY